MKTKYNKQYFIKFFQKIPAEEIGKGTLRNHCALWHLGVRIKDSQYSATPVVEKKVMALAKILKLCYESLDFIGATAVVYNVNDHSTGCAKDNLLGALT